MVTVVASPGVVPGCAGFFVRLPTALGTDTAAGPTLSAGATADSATAGLDRRRKRRPSFSRDRTARVRTAAVAGGVSVRARFFASLVGTVTTSCARLVARVPGLALATDNVATVSAGTAGAAALAELRETAGLAVPPEPTRDADAPSASRDAAAAAASISRIRSSASLPVQSCHTSLKHLCFP